MDERSHKALISRFYDEVWNKGNLDVADEVLALDYVRHDLRAGNPPGPEGMKRIASDLRAAFPDLHLAVTFMVAEENMVVARWVTTGTHKGKWGNIEPTGRHAEFSGVNIWRFSHGKVVELWNYRDDLGLMQHLGVPMHGGAVD